MDATILLSLRFSLGLGNRIRWMEQLPPNLISLVYSISVDMHYPNSKYLHFIEPKIALSSLRSPDIPKGACSQVEKSYCVKPFFMSIGCKITEWEQPFFRRLGWDVEHTGHPVERGNLSTRWLSVHFICSWFPLFHIRFKNVKGTLFLPKGRIICRMTLVTWQL